MNLTREVILWLESKTSKVAGEDLFQGPFPIGDEDGTSVVQIGGDENESYLRSSVLHFSVQEKDYDTAEETTRLIWDLISFSNGIELLNGEKVFNSTPVKYPSYITTTEHDLVLWTCSATFYFEK